MKKCDIMIREIHKDENGYRLCIMDLSDLHKYIYKKSKETEKYTFADIIFDLEQKKKTPSFVDDKGNVYYSVIEHMRKFFVQ